MNQATWGLIESSKLMLINWFRVATDNRFYALQFSLELAAFFVEMLPFNLRMQPNPILPGMKKCMYSAFLGYTCWLFSRNYCENCLYFQFVSYFVLPWSGQLCPASFGICIVSSWETHRAPIIPESYKASGRLHAVGLMCGPFHYQVVPFEAKFVPLSPPKPIGFAAKVASTLYWAIQHQFLLVRFVKVPFLFKLIQIVKLKCDLREAKTIKNHKKMQETAVFHLKFPVPLRCVMAIPPRKWACATIFEDDVGLATNFSGRVAATVEPGMLGSPRANGLNGGCVMETWLMVSNMSFYFP